MHAKAARAVYPGSFIEAESWNENVIFSGNFKDSLTRESCNFFAVYIKSELVHFSFPPPLFLLYGSEFACFKTLAALDALVLIDDMLFLYAAGNSSDRTFLRA